MRLAGPSLGRLGDGSRPEGDPNNENDRQHQDDPQPEQHTKKRRRQQQQANSVSDMDDMQAECYRGHSFVAAIKSLQKQGLSLANWPDFEDCEPRWS